MKRDDGFIVQCLVSMPVADNGSDWICPARCFQVPAVEPFLISSLGWVPSFQDVDDKMETQ